MTISTSGQGSQRELSIVSKKSHHSLNHGRSASEQRATPDFSMENELRPKASSTSPIVSNDLTIREKHASIQGSKFLNPSPLGNRSLANSSSPERTLKHFDLDLVNNEASDDIQSQCENSSKLCNEMPPPKTFKRKLLADGTFDFDGESLRNVRARSLDIAQSLIVSDTGPDTDNLILTIIKGIENLAEEKYHYCIMASKMHDLKSFMDCKANKVMKSSHDRYANVCEEVKGCNEKVKEQRSKLLRNFKDLLGAQKSPLCQASEIFNEETLQSGQNMQKASNKAYLIKSEPSEETDTVINDVNENGGDNAQSLVQAKLAEFEDSLPELIEQAINRHRENADACFSLQSNAKSTDSNQKCFNSEESTEVKQLRNFVKELKQDSQKKTQEIEKLQRILENVQENMAVQERIVVFNTAAILRHEGGLLRLNDNSA